MSNILTKDGLLKIKTEIKLIKEVKLKEIAERIRDAKDFGDLAENAEYQEARNDQAFLYRKLMELEEKVKHAEIIDRKNCNTVVEAGCTVIVENEGEKMTFEIVGSDESDPLNGRISVASPLGSSLVGHKKGDFVEVEAPKGTAKYKIIEIR